MASRRRTWQEKLEDKTGYPKFLKLEEGFPCYNALHKMGLEAGDEVVLVRASDVVGIMKQVPEGKVVTLKEICQALAARHGAKGCCTLTSGIFVMTAANAVEEAAAHGKDLGIPYWRTLKIDGFLNEKYPGGEEGQRRMLEEEGHKVSRKGRRLFVEDLAASLYNVDR